MRLLVRHIAWLSFAAAVSSPAIVLGAEQESEPAAGAVTETDLSDEELRRQYMAEPTVEALAFEFGKEFSEFTDDDKLAFCDMVADGGEKLAGQLPLEVDPTTTLESVKVEITNGLCEFRFDYTLDETVFLGMVNNMAQANGANLSLAFLQEYYSVGEGNAALLSGLRAALVQDPQISTLSKVPFMNIRVVYDVVGEHIGDFELILKPE